MQDIKTVDLEVVTGGAEAKDVIKEWQDFCGSLYRKADQKRKDRFTPAADEWQKAAGSCMESLSTARDVLGLRAKPEE